MDRYSSWPGPNGPSGGAGSFGASPRGRRVPPRAPQQRRSAPRTTVWDGARRWWWVALCTWMALLILPRMLPAQGLRSNAAAITLQVTAPPELRTPNAVTWRGASVADLSLRLPPAPFPVARVEARLLDAAGTSPEAARLYARDGQGALRLMGDTWTVVAGTGAPGMDVASFRAVAMAGTPLAPSRWRLNVRRMPHDSTFAPVESVHDLALPARR